MTSNNPRRRNGWRRDQLVARHRAAGKNCYICGRPIDYTLKAPNPYSFVVDETIPVARGGSPYSWANTGPAHRWCNQVKGVHSLEWARREVQRIINGKGPSGDVPASLAPYRKLGL